MRIGIIGHFSFKKEDFGGQAIKTQNYLAILSDNYGKENIKTLDTYCFKKYFFKNILSFFHILLACKHIILMPTSTILKYLVPILIYGQIFKRNKLIYVVIGGWLPNLLEESPYLIKYLKRFEAIHVETNTMVKKLEAFGFSNVQHVPNFSLKKNKSEVDIDHKVFNQPYPLCTFSRVKKEKGIGSAMDAVNSINLKYGKRVCTLDIYGQIDPEFEDEFETLLKRYGDQINYKGIVKGDKATDILSSYYLLLFPTYYQGEGFPGTLVDAFNAGTPIIASDWKYNNEIICNYKTGIIYPLTKEKGLENSIDELINNPYLARQMRFECLKESNKYKPDIVMRSLFDIIDRAL